MDNLSKQYDFIFLGAGCATLSIIMRMIASQNFSEKKILLIDKEPKSKNDRTWCFWQKEKGFFEEVINKKWTELLFKTEDVSISLDIVPYQYKMIRGIDFYNFCFSKIAHQPHIEIQYGNIEFVENEIKLNNKILPTGKAIIFNSIYQPAKKEKNKFYLIQHFKGWIIETRENIFDEKQGTLMDFSVEQKHGTTFVYVLPLASNKALVEYTLFTENLLQKEEYDVALKNYLYRHLNINTYEILEEEFGIIPMTNAKFKSLQNGRYNIGTAGGQTKASTGYTFQFIQKQAQQIVDDLILKGVPSKKMNAGKRFQFYDSTLLHILSKNKPEGKDIFTRLFKKNKASAVFKFLDNETNVGEEIRIINSLPKKEFLAAGIKEFFKLI